ncbi:MAG TPA: helix-turn-helix domain-containing protein [Solirubrobacterales bacterium]|nr:helix-turn-helix domain-containing protein [Solirubrobacterales bacterium]
MPEQTPLSQPTRSRLYARLVELRRPASTEELATHAGLHVNGVRRHLERLTDAGLVERRRVRHGRGRPRDEWALAADAEPEGKPPRRYADLARWLVRAIPDGPEGVHELERIGSEIGRELAPEPGPRPAQSFKHVLTALGFQPALELERSGEVTCRLRNCPYVESVRERADLICTLHRGITAGLVSELAPAAELARWEPHDPDRAGCIAGIIRSGWEPADVESTADQS